MYNLSNKQCECNERFSYKFILINVKLVQKVFPRMPLVTDVTKFCLSRNDMCHNIYNWRDFWKKKFTQTQAFKKNSRTVSTVHKFHKVIHLLRRLLGGRGIVQNYDTSHGWYKIWFKYCLTMCIRIESKCFKCYDCNNWGALFHFQRCRDLRCILHRLL